MSKCKGCGAEIVWIKTTAGKAMPCDPNTEKQISIDEYLQGLNEIKKC